MNLKDTYEIAKIINNNLEFSPKTGEAYWKDVQPKQFLKELTDYMYEEIASKWDRKEFLTDCGIEP